MSDNRIRSSVLSGARAVFVKYWSNSRLLMFVRHELQTEIERINRMCTGDGTFAYQTFANNGRINIAVIYFNTGRLIEVVIYNNTMYKIKCIFKKKIFSMTLRLWIQVFCCKDDNGVVFVWCAEWCIKLIIVSLTDTHISVC